MTTIDKMFRSGRCLAQRSIIGAATVVGACVCTDLAANADLPPLVGELHDPVAEHVDQMELLTFILEGKPEHAFEHAFEGGDELFEAMFNSLDGAGADVGNGQRFTRVPRADLAAPGAWATHTPPRATGPNAQSCTSCHIVPTEDGAGMAGANVHRDPMHSATLGSMIQRNTPHVFGMAGPQRLAEEMTEELHSQRQRAADRACATGRVQTIRLSAKGVSFGQLIVTPGGSPCAPTFDTSGISGVAADLVVRPFQWKGSVAFARDFNRGAAHNELGMQAVEVAGDGVDGDHDCIANEMTVGDMTAMAIYVAAQPRPTTRVELASLGLIPPLTAEEAFSIGIGRATFSAIGCAECHRPSLTVSNLTFSEPSENPNFRDAVFPAGQDPIALGVDPATPVTFDITRDQPDNQILDANGHLVFHLGAFRRNAAGRAVIELFGDLRRHDMGPDLAESIDEVGTGASVFLTENLWGVGSTAPYMHDGRATTLTEAILMHGGEATHSRRLFAALPRPAQRAVIAFLDNLVLFKLPQP